MREREREREKVTPPLICLHNETSNRLKNQE